MFFSNVSVAVLLIYSIVCACGDVRFLPREKYNKTLQVKTLHGIVQGKEGVTVNGATFFAYQGIPFGRPPLNELRFKEPNPYPKWVNVLDGTRDVFGCVEIMVRFTGLYTIGDEDCLYLKVHTPQLPQRSAEPLPVMIWIYGGSFLEGNSSSAVYGSDYFIEHGVILVEFNYRLGMFGFLATNDAASPGNYGLKDQLAVLKWVKHNIKFFGGDPSRITIFGNSAGGCSVIHHMLAKASRGLFSGAIAMSGVSLTPWCNKKSPENLAADIASSLGIARENTTQLIDVLRNSSTEELKEIQLRVVLVHGVRIYHEGLPFTPTVEPVHEGAFITEPSYELLVRGDVAKIPLIIGRTSMEGKFFSAALPLLRFLTLYFDLSPGSLTSVLDGLEEDKPQIGKTIISRYFQSNSVTASTDEELIQFTSDIFFNIPIDTTIKLLYKHIPVYAYVYNYNSEYVKIAYEAYTGIPPIKIINDTAHGEDLPVVFHFKNIRMPDPTDNLIKDRIITLWTNFAKYRNATPSPDELLQDVLWPKVESSDNIPYLQIGREIKVKTNFRSEYMRFWEQLLSKYKRT